ncbi:hypothetical protein ACFYON_22035 [Micromonospora sp. NPDC005686]|uniref:hypothetical protein n=1 Tax=unclassified Micromonospora TaxID=2617518 RepID=UPI0033A89448
MVLTPAAPTESSRNTRTPAVRITVSCHTGPSGVVVAGPATGSPSESSRSSR